MDNNIYYATSEWKGNLNQPIPFHQGSFITTDITGNIYYDNQPDYVRILCVVYNNVIHTYWLSKVNFTAPRHITFANGNEVDDYINDSFQINYRHNNDYNLDYYIMEVNNPTSKYDLTVSGKYHYPHIMSDTPPNEYDFLTVIYGNIRDNGPDYIIESAYKTGYYFKKGNKIDVYFYLVLVRDESVLENLPIEITSGSWAYTAGGKKVWQLDFDGEWIPAFDEDE